MHNEEDVYEDEPVYSGPSRSQKKREMTALQKVAERLLKQSDDLIKKSGFPDYFIEAILHAKSITAHEGKRRQVQYIGKLIRGFDPQPIIDFLDNIEFGNRDDNMKFHKIEKWRDKLIEGDFSILDELMELYPHAERQRLSQLARNAKKEIEKKKPLKSSKALFKALREMVESAS
ncbi:MAG: hypothetical protein BA863_03220 [Desulfovibrio sp. S3730MH75]|nr:MAG: hypothetical protein BA863_03220 [Desulfovibrio sp. S3730MH75]